MIYEKEKIHRIFNLKEKLTNKQLQKDLEWIMEFYNNNFKILGEYEKAKEEIRKMRSTYFDVVDKNYDLKKRIESLNLKIKRLKSCKNT